MICAICDGTRGTQHLFREMMFGTRDEFVYWECSHCGCLQIAEVPTNLGDHYQENYYSFSNFSPRVSPTKQLLYRSYSKAPRLAKNLVRYSARHGLIPQAGPLRSVIDANPKPKARILDVGCGGGRLVNKLRSIGFDAHGIDPFAKDETECVRRISLDESEKGWDLIMFHHSLEHMTDNIGVLRSAREKLADNGTCLVRIPLVNWAWRHYKENWAQLDAPRHLIIHTPQSFRLASEIAGFSTSRINFDSTAFQFCASELYQRNIPLNEKSAESELLDKRTMRRLGARAVELNREQLGDQAAFYLKRS